MVLVVECDALCDPFYMVFEWFAAESCFTLVEYKFSDGASFYSRCVVYLVGLDSPYSSLGILARRSGFGTAQPVRLLLE